MGWDTITRLIKDTCSYAKRPRVTLLRRGTGHRADAVRGSPDNAENSCRGERDGNRTCTWACMASPMTAEIKYLRRLPHERTLISIFWYSAFGKNFLLSLSSLAFCENTNYPYQLRDGTFWYFPLWKLVGTEKKSSDTCLIFPSCVLAIHLQNRGFSHRLRVKYSS